jgi:hypothetical protein
MGCLAAPNAWAFDTDRTIEGCEADAMTVSLGLPGRLSWDGERHTVGPWTFASHVRIECDGTTCQATTGRATITVEPDGWDSYDAAAVFDRIAVEQSRWFNRSATLMSAMSNVTRVVYRIDGSDASDIAQALGSGWVANDGSMRRVFIDDESISEIRISARTSLACAADASFCEVDVTTLIDVPDNPTSACPVANSASGF